MQKFLSDVAAYGHPDFEPKLIGRGVNVMISPLPRNKRGKPTGQTADGEAPAIAPPRPDNQRQAMPVPIERPTRPEPEELNRGGFANNPFAQLEINR